MSQKHIANFHFLSIGNHDLGQGKTKKNGLYGQVRKDFRCLIIYFPKELLLFSTDCEFVLLLISRGGHGTRLENLDGPNFLKLRDVQNEMAD